MHREGVVFDAEEGGRFECRPGVVLDADQGVAINAEGGALSMPVSKIVDLTGIIIATIMPPSSSYMCRKENT